MPKTERFFEQVASSISDMRGTVQNDLDRCYSVNGSIVLDQLTELLADVLAAHYACFKRDAFLEATHVPQGSSHRTDSACDDPGIRSRIVCTHDRDQHTRRLRSCRGPDLFAERG
jgi:hypothetical protein